jgi:Ca2+-binding EF-hand superfamily protein
MRATTLFALLILGSATLIVAPAITTGQGKKGGGGPGGFMMTQDPNAVFDMLARGKTYIVPTDSRSMGTQLAQFAQEKGLANGQISRQQFVDFMTQYKAKMAAGGAPILAPQGGFGKGKKGGIDLSMLPPGLNIAPGQPPTQDMINQLADADFKIKDLNGDGKLNAEEMPGRLRGNLAKYDKNGDGLIDLLEYREYFTALISGNRGGDQQDGRGNAIIIEEDILDAKPVVFRAGGKTPANLPAWFTEFDTDKDGQVALYEWRKAGKPLDDFRKWDLNDDGVITMEEAVKYQASLDKDDPNAAKSTAFGGGKKTGGRPSFDNQDGGGRPSMDGGGFKTKGGGKKKGGGG